MGFAKARPIDVHMSSLVVNISLSPASLDRMYVATAPGASLWQPHSASLNAQETH